MLRQVRGVAATKFLSHLIRRLLGCHSAPRSEKLHRHQSRRPPGNTWQAAAEDSPTRGRPRQAGRHYLGANCNDPSSIGVGNRCPPRPHGFTCMRPSDFHRPGNRQLEAARLARQRELHLTRLATVELRPARSAPTTVRAGGGPPRPWLEKPHQMPQKPRGSVRGRSVEQQEHIRNVTALFGKLQAVAVGAEWRQREHQERAMTTGRAKHSNVPARRRVQRQTALESEAYYKRLRQQTARFASPSAIALLTGKPPPGSGGAEEPPGDDE